MKKILLIIPAYNEAGNIAKVIDNLITNYPQYDYVVVNDGSKDRTAYICKDNGYNFIDLPVNLGLSGAFQAGLKYAYAKGYSYAVQFDGDGQHLPEYISSMTKIAEDGEHDIVIGSRFFKAQKPFTVRMLGSFLISFSIRLTTGRIIKDPTSGLRMFNRKMIELFAFNLNYDPEPDTISHLLRRGATVAEVQVQMQERTAGESYLTTYKSAMYMIRMGLSILLIQWFRN